MNIPDLGHGALRCRGWQAVPWMVLADPFRGGCVAECGAADADGWTVAAVGRGDDDGDDAAAERDGAAASGVDDDGVVAAVGDGGGGEPAVAGMWCNAKSCPSWALRCSRAPTYLLEIDVKQECIQARSHGPSYLTLYYLWWYDLLHTTTALLPGPKKWRTKTP